MKRLHIVGCPRSGTSLMLELMSTCFHCDGRCQHEMSIFHRPPRGEGLFISKQPNDIRQLQHIFGRDDNLHVIYLVRDPRAVITSQHTARPGEYFCNYRIWRACERAAAALSGHPRFIFLKYEDLVAVPDKTQERIEQQFPFLQRIHAFSQYQEFAAPAVAAEAAMSGLRAVGTGSLHKWRQHLPRVAEQYQRYPEMADELIRLGYETNGDWLTVLRDVEVRKHACRYPDRAQPLKEMEKKIRVWFKSRRYLRELADTRRCPRTP